MQVRRLVFLFLFCACAAIPLAQAQDANSAKQFVESLYKLYAKDGKGVPFTGPQARRDYDSSLLALMRADEKAAAGDVGVLDGDPICGCQDWEGIFDLHIDIQVQRPDRAIATVSFSLSEPKHRTAADLRHLTMTLVPENGQWRIWNIRDQSDPRNIFDVRDALNEEIQQLKKPARQQGSGTSGTVSPIR
jgi:hypothetical protein